MNYLKVTNDRQFRDATGFSRLNFDKLLLDFEKTYQEKQR